MSASPVYHLWLQLDGDHILAGRSVVPHLPLNHERRALEAWMNTHVGQYARDGKVDRAAFAQAVLSRADGSRVRWVDAKIESVIEAYERLRR